MNHHHIPKGRKAVVVDKPMNGEFIHGDCMDYLPQFEDNHFDLAIVDPPYGIGENGSTNHTRSKLAKSKNYKSFSGNDSRSPNKEYFLELYRVSKHQIIWGANHFISKIPHDTSCWIVWDKLNGTNDFADCELAWTSFNTAVRKFTFRWQGMLQGYSGNKTLNEKRIHPTQKPVSLYKWLLHNYAKEGDLILDTHIGSASSMIACEDMGFEYVGYELDKDYYQAATKRLQNYISQLKIF